MKKTLIITIALLVIGGCNAAGTGKKRVAETDPTEKKQSDLASVIPLTAANIRGHKVLYNEGWFVISSSEKAFAYAAEKSVASSKDVMTAVAADVVARFETMRTSMEGRVKVSVDMAKKTLASGRKTRLSITSATSCLVKKEYDYSTKKVNHAWQTFVYGNIALVKRTQNDVMRLRALPGNYYDTMNDDFSNIVELSNNANQFVSKKINLSWNRSFQKAGQLFYDEYERSGHQENALLALGNILHGYLKALYRGVVAPSAKTIVIAGVKGANYGLFLPGSAVTVVSGRTVQSTGLSLFYATSAGYKFVTPTVEAGVFGGLSLLTLGAVPVTYIGGTTFGAVNQVAFTAAAPVAGIGRGVVESSGTTGKYVALVVCDIATGTSKVLINQASSGLVLGYNALSAIPAHLFLGSVDTAVFLAWDGPRLVVAVASGKIKPDVSVGSLPVGAVVDINKLRQNKDVTVKIVSDDPVMIDTILEKVADDLREDE